MPIRRNPSYIIELSGSYPINVDVPDGCKIVSISQRRNSGGYHDENVVTMKVDVAFAQLRELITVLEEIAAHHVPRPYEGRD